MMELEDFLSVSTFFINILTGLPFVILGSWAIIKYVNMNMKVKESIIRRNESAIRENNNRNNNVNSDNINSGEE